MAKHQYSPDMYVNTSVLSARLIDMYSNITWNMDTIFMYINRYMYVNFWYSVENNTIKNTHVS